VSNFGSFEQSKAAINNGQMIRGSGALVFSAMYRDWLKDSAASQPEINELVRQDFYSGRYNHER